MERIEMHAIAKGRVQGVSFRYTTLSHAKSIGITGFVRNLANGSVEIFAQGTKEELERLLHLLKTENGAAEIAGIHSDFYAIQKSYIDFTIEK